MQRRVFRETGETSCLTTRPRGHASECFPEGTELRRLRRVSARQGWLAWDTPGISETWLRGSEFGNVPF